MNFLQYFCINYNPFDEHNWEYDAFKSEHLNQAKNRILYSAETQTICLITGKSGSGVTRTILESINALDENTYKVIYVPVGNYKTFDFYNIIAEKLGIYVNGYSKATIKTSIQNAITNIITKEDLKPVFIIDNAHMLDKEALYDLSLFYDFGLESGAQTCLLVAGNDLLRGKIRSLHFDSFADRIATNYKLKYLKPNEIGNYIKSQMPDKKYPLQFVDEKYLLEEISKITQGNYRKINMLMTNLMILANQKQLKCLSIDDVRKAKNEMFFC